jgi:hypothetical protein
VWISEYLEDITLRALDGNVKSAIMTMHDNWSIVMCCFYLMKKIGKDSPLFSRIVEYESAKKLSCLDGSAVESK